MDDKIDRFKMSEAGYLGLNIFKGLSYEEQNKDLMFPQSSRVYKEMSYHPTINAPLTLFSNLISKATWRFVPPVDATEEEKRQCELVESMMHDMETPWDEFVNDVLSVQTYGFSIHEKVYRKRLTSNGSKFNDGVIGWKKLPIRAQESIENFVYDKDGNELKGVKQNVSKLGLSANDRYQYRDKMEVVLPRSKFLHFRVGKHRGDPFGQSPLRNVYGFWRYLTTIEEIEATGVAKDLVGLPVLYLPPQYLSADATPEQQAIRAYYENAMRNLQMNQQSAMILPQAFDPDTKQPLFNLELLSLDGKKAIDTAKVKEYYKTMIMTALFADVLIMGQSSTGSFALGQIKNSLTGAAAEVLLKNIATVLNADLARQTYELNGWDTSRMGSFDFEELETADLETFSKAVQRFGATGFLPKTHDVINKVLSSIGVDELPESANLEELLPEQTTRSGDGMKEGMNSGTGSADGSSGNPSDLNSDNKA